MQIRVVRNVALSMLVVAAAIGYLIYLQLSGNTAAFNVVLGVVVGFVITVVPQALSRDSERLRRARAASVLVRSDLFEYQNWILRSLRDSEWSPPPTDIATTEHLAELAYAMPNWKRWSKLSQARRYTNHLIRLSENSLLDHESRRHARVTFEAINETKVLLAKVDRGSRKPHADTEEVRALALTPLMAQ
ncbi:hypothetical protein QE375_001929 [Microbacterium foliorum]|uniref:Uncharacterized protein n=1 Tax=Microbacterium foliorum TaxID=104336 RepID=A0ABU1HQP8_9MICO|nr:hypothetical protein [Microbacterium foliorum]MDR6142375.1 hypothetical protein [Microbacterium foliorum]